MTPADNDTAVYTSSRLLGGLPTRRNLLGTILCLPAFILLVVANCLPFLVIEQFGQRRSYTVIGGILKLFDEHNVLLGVVILFFSFLFPFIKLLMLLAGSGFLPVLDAPVRRVILWLAKSLARWSMLDVFVGAVLIVVVKTGDMQVLHSIMDVTIGSGTIVFCIAVILSTAAGATMSEPEGERVPTVTAPQKTKRDPPRNSKFGWFAVLGGLAALLIGGITFWFCPSAEDVAMVKAVRVTQKAGIDIKLLPNRKPDLYLELDTAKGYIHTGPEKQAIIGNGITFIIPPIRFRDIRSITAWDAHESTVMDNFRRKERLDRVDELGFEAVGGRFNFLFVTEGTWGPKRLVPLLAANILFGIGAVVLLTCSVIYFRRQGASK